MNNILDLDILNENINYDPDIKEFKEFCFNLNSLSVIVNPELYFEAMIDNNKSFTDKFSVSMPFKNTRKVTKDIKKAYGDVTDGGASLIGSIWDMSMKAIQLSAKILKFIFLNLAKIPKMIVGIAQTIGRIPQNVKNKVRGNITLYITVNDVNNLYKRLIPLLDKFLLDAKNVSNGEMWGTFFNRRPIGKGIVSKHICTENDMKYYKNMKSNYEKLKLIEFKQTVVKFEDQNVIDIYFGDSNSIKYDNGVNKTTSTYYDALVRMFEDFQEQNEFLKVIQKDMDIKLDKAQMNQSYGRLDESSQKIISETIQMISKIINIIGNLMRYVMIDIKTIKSSTDKMLKKSKILKVKNESVSFMESSSFTNKRKMEFDKKVHNLFGNIFKTKKQELPKEDKNDYKKNDWSNGSENDKLLEKVISEFTELTKRKSIKILSERSKTRLTRTQSKFGGIPYWPKNKPYIDEDFVMIAQINLEELPPGISNFPTKGIIQFFVDKDVCDNYDKCEVIYHDKISSDNNLFNDIELTTFAQSISNDNEFPFTGEFKLNMKLEEIPMSIDDYRFNEFFIPIFNKHFNCDLKNYWDIENTHLQSDIIYDSLSCYDSRIEGYPHFSQEDPRTKNTNKDILLLQIDSDYKEINWGDCGVGNFFINENDLKNKKFNNVMFTWDCS